MVLYLRLGFRARNAAPTAYCTHATRTHGPSRRMGAPIARQAQALYLVLIISPSPEIDYGVFDHDHQIEATCGALIAPKKRRFIKATGNYSFILSAV